VLFCIICVETAERILKLFHAYFKWIKTQEKKVEYLHLQRMFLSKWQKKEFGVSGKSDVAITSETLADYFSIVQEIPGISFMKLNEM